MLLRAHSRRLVSWRSRREGTSKSLATVYSLVRSCSSMSPTGIGTWSGMLHRYECARPGSAIWRTRSLLWQAVAARGRSPSRSDPCASAALGVAMDPRPSAPCSFAQQMVSWAVCRCFANFNGRGRFGQDGGDAAVLVLYRKPRESCASVLVGRALLPDCKPSGLCVRPHPASIGCLSFAGIKPYGDRWAWRYLSHRHWRALPPAFAGVSPPPSATQNAVRPLVNRPARALDRILRLTLACIRCRTLPASRTIRERPGGTCPRCLYAKTRPPSTTALRVNAVE
jgi:hypothetical protein